MSVSISGLFMLPTTRPFLHIEAELTWTRSRTRALINWWWWQHWTNTIKHLLISPPTSGHHSHLQLHMKELDLERSLSFLQQRIPPWRSQIVTLSGWGNVREHLIAHSCALKHISFRSFSIDALQSCWGYPSIEQCWKASCSGTESYAPNTLWKWHLTHLFTIIMHMICHLPQTTKTLQNLLLQTRPFYWGLLLLFTWWWEGSRWRVHRQHECWAQIWCEDAVKITFSQSTGWNTISSRNSPVSRIIN